MKINVVFKDQSSVEVSAEDAEVVDGALVVTSSGRVCLFAPVDGVLYFKTEKVE